MAKAPKLLTHPILGPIELRMRRDSANITARWRNGHVIITLPANVDPSRLYDSINNMSPRILAKRPSEPVYKIPSTLTFPGVTFEFKHQSLRPDTVTARIASGTVSIGIGPGIDPASAQGAPTVSHMLVRCAGRIAPGILLPRARELASSLGLAPASWSISAGHRTLGRCSAKGEIALSRDLVFLPQNLRDYIVMHELAHLSEMNHSPKFHALCNSYCNGREKELAALLRHHNWPIMR